MKKCHKKLACNKINCNFAKIVKGYTNYNDIESMKRFYNIILALGLMVAPMAVHAVPAIEIIENDFDGQKGGISLRVSTDDNGQTRLRVTNATNQTILIYDISGAPIKKIKVDGADKVYELNLRKGCYIVKVGNVVRKVSVS